MRTNPPNIEKEPPAVSERGRSAPRCSRRCEGVAAPRQTAIFTVSLWLLAPAFQPCLLAQSIASPTSALSIEERLQRLEERQGEMERAIKAKDARIEELEKELQQQRQHAQPVTPPAAQVPPPAEPLSGLRAEAPQKTSLPSAEAGLAEEKTEIPYRESFSGDEDAAPRPGNAPIDPEYRGFTPLFGTRTWIRLGGYAKLDAITDSTQVGNPNTFITSEIPVAGQANYGTGEQFTLQAKQTRINLELRAPTPLGSLRIVYENDFFGDSDQPTMDYRLRHFYGQVANMTVGQTWSTFYDPDVKPDTIDLAGPNALSSLRQPEFRYTLPIIKDRMHLAMSIEQPQSDISAVPSTGSPRTVMPDVVSQWRWEGPLGHLQVAGVLRDLAFNNTAGPTDSALGWGANFSGVLKSWGKDAWLADFTYGDGIGRYIQDLPDGSAAVVTTNGNLQTLTAYGTFMGYEHYWTDHWRSTATYGFVHLQDGEQGGSAFKKTDYVSANLIWSPTPHVSMGLEYLYGFKGVQSGLDGNDHRLQLSIKYNLVR